VSILSIVTDRLLLRSFTADDFDAYATIVGDPEVSRYLGDGRPLGRAEAWRQLAMIIGHWELRGFGLWAVEERATATLVGRIGCFEPEGWPGLEIGYTLARSHWGRGFATEGAGAALRFAREELRAPRAISLIHPDNAASIRVAERLGATATGTTELGERPVRVYTYPSAGA
jgi:RimJ/RimL family protein N-acetyltransferase